MKMDISRKASDESEFADVSIEKFEFSHVDKNFLKHIDAKRKRFKLENLLKNPARAYISNYDYSIVTGSVCGGVIITLLLLWSARPG